MPSSTTIFSTFRRHAALCAVLAAVAMLPACSGFSLRLPSASPAATAPRDDLGRIEADLAARKARLQTLRTELGEAQARSETASYGVAVRLQAGSPPDNPGLIEQQTAARTAINQMALGATELRAMASETAADAARAAYLLEATPAGDAQRPRIAALAPELQRVYADLSAEADRQAAAAAAARPRLEQRLATQPIAVGLAPSMPDAPAPPPPAPPRAPLIPPSPSVAPPPAPPAAPPAPAAVPATPAPAPAAAAPPAPPPTPPIPPAAPPAAIARPPAQAAVTAPAPLPPAPGAATPSATRRALVTIRFDVANPDYGPALRDAVGQVRERRPESIFEVMAVSGSAMATVEATEARRHADAVRRAILDMGVPPDKIEQGSEVRVGASGPEVRIYIR